PVRLHPRPRHREPVGGQAEVGHELHVLTEAVVVVAGHVAGVTAGDRSGDAAERVPDRRAAAVLVDRALDLVRRGRGPPPEPCRKRQPPRRTLPRRHLPLSRHCLTAPSMIPPMICFPNATKITTSG